MAQVGAFPGQSIHKRTIRAPINPMDKSTVVSIYPREIDETKPTIQPGRFIIPPGKLDKPSILVVGPSSWWREIDEEQPLLEIPVSSIQIADSIVKDYLNGILACDMDSAMPGLFYVPGEISLPRLQKEFPHELQKAHARQNNWYSSLIKLADSLWARSNGNPLAISDDMRLAAREMGVSSTKDWMKDFSMMEMVRCVACGALRNPLFPVCQTCKAIADPEAAAKLNLKFAQ